MQKPQHVSSTVEQSLPWFSRVGVVRAGSGRGRTGQSGSAVARLCFAEVEDTGENGRAEMQSLQLDDGLEGMMVYNTEL